MPQLMNQRDLIFPAEGVEGQLHIEATVLTDGNRIGACHGLAKAEVQKPFPQEEELKTKSERLNELNAMLNLDKRENEIVDGERGEEEPQKSSADRER